MAMSMISFLRRRSAVSLSSIIFNHHTPSLSLFSPAHLSQSSSPDPVPVPHLLRAFRSTNISFALPRQNDLQIGPEDVLFAGCDYNHWLITMDFPQDQPLSPEEMVQAYVHTAASVLGSVEEAMKRIYACSTTTYTGFQLEVSEEVAKMFQGLPGVVFILPDSYIDPVNKQYGGDKYDNGIITRRPAPGQYGRQGGMFGDRNRDFNRPSRPRGESQQRHPAFDDPRPTGVSAGNFGAPQNPTPQQNYGPPRVASVNNSAGGQENYQGQMRDQMLPNQGSYIQSQRGDSYPQGQRMPLGGFNNNAPQQGVNWQGAGGSYRQGAGGSYEQAAGGSYGQGASGSYGQGTGGVYGQGAGGVYEQGAGGQGSGGSYVQGAIRNHGHGSSDNIGHISNGNFGPGSGSNYGQGVGSNYGQGTTGSYEQGASGSYGQGATGSYGQGTVGDVPGQEKFPNYGHNNPVHDGSQRF